MKHPATDDYDLRLGVNGTNGYLNVINNFTLTTNGKNSLYAAADAGTFLYFNGSLKLQTTNIGVSVTGQGVFSAAITASTYIQGTSSNGGLKFYSDSSTSKGVVLDTNDHLVPTHNNAQDLGSTSYRWRDIYTNDLNLSNEGSTNSVDNTWGDYTIQEGESDLFLINNRNGKKYKFNLTEVS